MYNQILNLFSCLEKNQKNKFLIFVVILFFASILEALGIGIIIPLISAILDSENTFINYLPYEVKKFLLSFDKISLIIFLSFLICLFFIFKNLILIIISFFQSRYVFGIKDSLEKKIFKSYLMQNYSNFMKINSSRRINNLIVETQNIVEGAIIPIMILVTELLVLLSISTLLLIYNFKITILSISVLLLITSLSIIFLKPLFKKWGEQRTIYNQQKAEILNQSIFGIREIKLFKMSKGTIETFNKFNKLLNLTSYKHIFLQSITRFYLEIGAIISFVTVVIIFLKSNSNTNELITLLSLYGVSIFRIMPSINKIINSKNSLRFSEAPVKKILEDINFAKKNTLYDEKINNKIIEEEIYNWKKIKIDNLKFSYTNKENIFENLNFEISKGKKIAIIGETGSGKSTFIDLISNLLEPKEGKIFVDDKEVVEKNRNSYVDLFSYSSQNTFIFNSSVADNISLVSLYEDKKIDYKKIELVTKVTQLEKFIDNLEKREKTIIGEEGNRLSGGQKQRLGIARSIYAGRDILIFDEATSALDNNTEKKLLDELFEKFNDKTIIFVTHKQKILEYFDEIFEIKDKKIKTLNKTDIS